MEANRGERELDDQIAEMTNKVLQGQGGTFELMPEVTALEPVIVGLASWFSEAPSDAFAQRLSSQLDQEWSRLAAPVKPGTLTPNRVRPPLTIVPRRRNWMLPAMAAAVAVVVIVSALLVPQEEGMLNGSSGIGALPVEGLVVLAGLTIAGVGYYFWRRHQ